MIMVQMSSKFWRWEDASGCGVMLVVVLVITF